MYATIAYWYLADGAEAPAAHAALRELAAEVQATEPGTLMYLAHTPGASALPPVSPRQIVFFESYRDKGAFTAHITGKAFTGFLARHGSLFAKDANDNVFMEWTEVDRLAGFVRLEVAG